MSIRIQKKLDKKKEEHSRDWWEQRSRQQHLQIVNLRQNIEYHETRAKLADIYIAACAGTALAILEDRKIYAPFTGTLKIDKDFISTLMDTQAVSWEETEDKKTILMHFKTKDVIVDDVEIEV